MSYVQRYWAPVIGFAAIVAGVVLALTPPESFGWFAYAPLSGSGFSPRFVTPYFLVGIAILIAGVALFAGWVGFRLGRRDSVEE